jgi:hypothetical protein
MPGKDAGWDGLAWIPVFAHGYGYCASFSEASGIRVTVPCVPEDTATQRL